VSAISHLPSRVGGGGEGSGREAGMGVAFPPLSMGDGLGGTGGGIIKLLPLAIPYRLPFGVDAIAK
jgi:hypothetical protein